MRSFFFHFNKPQTQRDGRPRISVHYKDTCYIVDNVVCDVPTKGRLKKTQPRFVMTGRCSSMQIVDDIAYIR